MTTRSIAAFTRSPTPARAAARALSMAGDRTDGNRSDSKRRPRRRDHRAAPAGEIMAIKGIGGFHLSVDATNEPAVMRPARAQAPLRQAAGHHGARSRCGARTLRSHPEEEALLLTPARPIVLAQARPANGIAPSVAPGIPWLGIFLPYAPLQHLLFADPRVKALVMTSANLSEEPIAIDNDEARARLAAIADAFLMHDREILQRCDDSVAAVVDGAPQMIRRARGFVPLAVPSAARRSAAARRRRPPEKCIRAGARQVRLPEPAPRRS